ncbi:MAG: thioredoxin family protein [candidate division Zixibacteria bacterium]|nr:thioredoxin family protein [candidate division Zixibacteria bacterium]
MKRSQFISFFLFSLLLIWSCGGGSDSPETGNANDTPRTSSQEASSQATTDVSSDKITWYDYDEGMRLVVGTSKFAIIYFDTSDCAPCIWMEDSLFSNPEVIEAVNRDFVPIKVQSARSDSLHYQGRTFTESHLRKIFKLPGYPMVLFLEGERNQIVGGQPSIIYPDRFLNYMRYHTSKAYRVVTFEEYLENLEQDKK